jgi:hypothetical protein
MASGGWGLRPQTRIAASRHDPKPPEEDYYSSQCLGGNLDVVIAGKCPASEGHGTMFLKDPDATIDYAVDWAAGYLAGQTIVASVWAVAPAGPTAPRVLADIVDGGRAIATIAGGVAGGVFRITNRVTFSDGRSDERTLTLRVEQR